MTTRMKPGWRQVAVRCAGALLLVAAANSAGQGAAIDDREGVVRLALATEPPSLDSVRATDQVSAFVLAHIGEGLLQYDRDNRLAPAVAERYELNDRGATFWLRRDARWEDGSPLTASDFVYAWREVLRPANGAQYAPLLFPLLNARAIAAGEAALETLGVSAPEDYRLELRFAEPCAWFPALTALMTLLPLPREFHARQGSRYAADAGRLLGNGPYRLARWVHGAELVLEQNPWHRDAAALGIRRIEIPYITSDSRAELNLFLDGRIALANVPGDALGQVLAQRLRLRQFRDGYVWFLGFNFRAGRLTGNRALRQAIQAAIEPREVVDQVVRLPGVRPAESLFPSVLRAGERRFIDAWPLAPVERSRARAQELIGQARRELGAEGLAPLTLLSSEDPVSVKLGEYLQARLAQTLGLDVRLDRQIFKQRIQKMNSGDYDMVLANWGPDFDDPITFGELFASWNPVNRGRFSSREYDRLVRAAQTASDPAARLAAMNGLQILVRDEVPVIPLYENARLYVQHPRLRGVVRAPFGGDPILRHAWLGPP